MKENLRTVGTAYEKKAGAYLEQNGYRIVTYNYRCKSGEIDIIAQEGDTLVFCEVKYRVNERLGTALEAVDVKKQKKISKCAFYYINTRQLQYMPCRFDVIGILGEDIQLIKDAFEYAG